MPYSRQAAAATTIKLCLFGMAPQSKGSLVESLLGCCSLAVALQIHLYWPCHLRGRSTSNFVSYVRYAPHGITPGLHGITPTSWVFSSSSWSFLLQHPSTTSPFYFRGRNDHPAQFSLPSLPFSTYCSLQGYVCYAASFGAPSPLQFSSTASRPSTPRGRLEIQACQRERPRQGPAAREGALAQGHLSPSKMATLLVHVLHLWLGLLLS